MADIFLSYASEDRERVAPLVGILETSGFSVWWDQRLRTGGTWPTVIDQTLRSVRCVVVAWSPASVASRWVKLETQDAYHRGLPIFPVMLDEVGRLEIPLELRYLHVSDLTAWSGEPEDAQVVHLVESIRGAVRAVEPGDGAASDVRSPVTREDELLLTGHARRRGSSSVLSWARDRLALLVVALALVGGGVALWQSGMGRDRPVVVGVMRIHATGPTKDWLCVLMRDKLTTWLSKFSKLEVVHPDLIDSGGPEHSNPVAVGQSLGIDKMVVGRVATMDGKMILTLNVVDVDRNGRIDSAGEVTGSEGEFEQMQNLAAEQVIKALGVDIRGSEIDQLLALRTNAKPSDYRLVIEQMGGFAAEEKADEPSEEAPGPRGWWIGWPAQAHAQAAQPADDEQAVGALVERYRTAIESKDLPGLAALHVEMTDGMREAFGQYFQNADDLAVNFSDVVVQIAGDRGVATFTRNDVFRDAKSGREVRLEIRVSTIVERQDDEWRIRGREKPS